MSEIHPNLVAWLDGELPPAEAAAVANHLESCEACRRQFAGFRETSAAVQIYCDAVLAEAHFKSKRLRSVAAFAALAAVAVVVFFLAFPRERVVEPSPAPSAVATLPSPSPEPAVLVTPKHLRHHHPLPASPRRAAAAWSSVDTAVEIAIPADAVFAPGALPEGTRLFGEMRIGPDGSLREIRLRQ